MTKIRDGYHTKNGKKNRVLIQKLKFPTSWNLRKKNKENKRGKIIKDKIFPDSKDTNLQLYKRASLLPSTKYKKNDPNQNIF